VRVLILLPSIISGGAERFNLDLAVGLNRSGVETDIFAWAMTPGVVDASVPQSLAAAGVRVFGGRPGRTKMRYEAPEIVARALLAARRYDVIVGGLELTSTYLASVAASTLGKPAVGEAQTFLDYVLGKEGRATAILAKLLYPRLDALVAVSDDVLHGATDLQLAPPRSRVIGNGIDVDRIVNESRASGGTLPHAPQQEPNVVAVGRMVDFKGFDLLIAAHAKVLGRGFAHTLVLVGDGPDRRLLEERARILGVTQTVRFPGYCTNPYALLANAQLFCLSSRREAFGIVLLEALALGVPIVATACSTGPRWILEEGRYGELVEPHSVDALADAIARHLEDPTALAARAALGLERVQDFSIQGIAAEYANLFGELLDGRRRNGDRRRG
jgi:glycosyltransferase involved in cell wall biosynthesis